MRLSLRRRERDAMSNSCVSERWPLCVRRLSDNGYANATVTIL